MLMIRYHFWLLVFHFCKFFQMSPFMFMKGLIFWPYFLIKRLASHPDDHAWMVTNAINNLREFWEGGGHVARPPKFVMKGLETLKSDAMQLQ